MHWSNSAVPKAVVPLNIRMLNALLDWFVDRFVTPMHYISKNINTHARAHAERERERPTHKPHTVHWQRVLIIDVFVFRSLS
jgi:hypothetical protein